MGWEDSTTLTSHQIEDERWREPSDKWCQVVKFAGRQTSNTPGHWPQVTRGSHVGNTWVTCGSHVALFEFGISKPSYAIQIHKTIRLKLGGNRRHTMAQVYQKCWPYEDISSLPVTLATTGSGISKHWLLLAHIYAATSSTPARQGPNLPEMKWQIQTYFINLHYCECFYVVSFLIIDLSTHLEDPYSLVMSSDYGTSLMRPTRVQYRRATMGGQADHFNLWTVLDCNIWYQTVTLLAYLSQSFRIYFFTSLLEPQDLVQDFFYFLPFARWSYWKKSVLDRFLEGEDLKTEVWQETTFIFLPSTFFERKKVWSDTWYTTSYSAELELVKVSVLWETSFKPKVLVTSQAPPNQQWS